MLVLSIGLHASLVGIAALLPRGFFDHAPKKEDLIDLGVDIELGDEVQELIVAENAPPPEPLVTPPEPVPAPPVETPPMPEEPPPPPVAEPEFKEPTPPPPPPREKPKPERPATPKPAPRPRAEPPPEGAKRGAVAQEGVVGGNVARSEKTTGTPGGQKVSDVGWRTPRPPYPFAARKTRIQGSGSIRIRTNAAGKVVSAETVEAIHPLLDSNTVRYALSSWSGPPNTTKTVPVTYQLR